MLLIKDFQGDHTTSFLSTKNKGCPFNLNLKGSFLKSVTEGTVSFLHIDSRIMQEYPKQ